MSIKYTYLHLHMFAIVVSVWWIEKVNVGALEYSRFLFAMDKGWTQ